jgi:hypothetical protein
VDNEVENEIENDLWTEFGDTPFQADDEASRHVMDDKENEMEDDKSTGPEFGDTPFDNEDCDPGRTSHSQSSDFELLARCKIQNVRTTCHGGTASL